MSARGKALSAIMAVLEEGAYSNLALAKELRGTASQDAAFIKQLVYGVLTYRLSLDYLLDLWLNRPLESLTPPIRNILRLGLYQVLYLEVPDHAAVDESVRLAHRLGHRGVAGLVNALLRRAVRSKDNLPWPKTDNPAFDLSIRYSLPVWMLDRWTERFSVAETEKLAAALNAPPGTDIRVNRLQATVEGALKELMEQQISARSHPSVADVISVERAALPELTLLKQGGGTVQGAASTLVGQVVAPLPGELVYDVCAAPGGKTLHMAELMNNTGRIVAFDLHAHRLRLMERAAKRLGITIVQPQSLDVTTLKPADWPAGQRVLVDAPCSGLGVIRRKPDIRWTRQPADIPRLAELQQSILRAVVPLVAPDGILVYSVCSTEPEETVGVIETFLREHPQFSAALWPEPLQTYWARELSHGYLYTYPHRHTLDGFFICRLKRSE